jgi:hypothetical protein
MESGGSRTLSMGLPVRWYSHPWLGTSWKWHLRPSTRAGTHVSLLSSTARLSSRGSLRYDSIMLYCYHVHLTLHIWLINLPMHCEGVSDFRKRGWAKKLTARPKHKLHPCRIRSRSAGTWKSCLATVNGWCSGWIVTGKARTLPSR